MYDYNCPDCTETKVQSDKNARKINEVIDQVNTLIQVNNETVDFIKEKSVEIIEETAEIKAIEISREVTELSKEVAETKVNELLNDIDTKIENLENDINTEIKILDSDINETTQQIENSKIGFDGNLHDTLKDRLDNDFNDIHQKVNDSSYLEYEGCYITANETFYGIQKDTVVKGRTLQNVLHEGMFDEFKPECWISTTQSSYWSFNNGYITINSNPGNYVNVFSKINEKIKPNTTYTIFLEVKENTLVTENSDLTAILSDGTIFTTRLTAKELFDVGIHVIKVMTVNEITTDVLLRTFIYNHVSEGYVTFRYMVLEGDHTETPLEELAYVDGIESVGDKSKNLFNKGITENILENQFINGDGDIQGSNKTLSVIQEVKPNTTYKLSGYYNRTVVRFEDKDRNFISTVNATKIKTPNNCKYIVCYIGTGEFNYQDTLDEFQIEEGEQATPYQPYYDGYKISGKSCEKNLFDGKIESGTINVDTGVNAVYDSTLRTTGYIKVKENTAYGTSFNIDYVKQRTASGKAYTRIYYYDFNKNFISAQYITLSFVTPSNCCYVRWLMYSQVIASEIENVKQNLNLQIEEGTEVTSYEPYQETTYSYILNEPLRSLRNGVCDEIDLTTGVLTRRVGKGTVDGSEKWTVYQDKENTISFICDANITTEFEQRDNVLCDRFVGRNHYSIDIEGIFINHTHSVRISILKTKLTSVDVDGFKKWLQENPVTFYYETLTTTEQLTPQQLKSFDTITHIISDNKLMPIVLTKIPSNVQAVITNLMNELETMGLEYEENNLKYIETNLTQEERITLIEMGVI